MTVSSGSSDGSGSCGSGSGSGLAQDEEKVPAPHGLVLPNHAPPSGATTTKQRV